MPVYYGFVLEQYVFFFYYSVYVYYLYVYVIGYGMVSWLFVNGGCL